MYKQMRVAQGIFLAIWVACSVVWGAAPVARHAERRVEAYRGEARSLRWEILFVQQRLEMLERERLSSIGWAVAKGLKAGVIGEIRDAFEQRRSRLMKRLDYLSGRLRRVEMIIKNDKAAKDARSAAVMYRRTDGSTYKER